MTNDELNRRMAELSNRADLVPDALCHCGKSIAFCGWFWRTVDFDRHITFAYTDGLALGVSDCVGFCENNKWGYEMFTATVEQSARVRALAEALASEPSKEHATALFDYMQTLHPVEMSGMGRWDSAESGA